MATSEQPGDSGQAAATELEKSKAASNMMREFVSKCNGRAFVGRRAAVWALGITCDMNVCSTLRDVFLQAHGGPRVHCMFSADFCVQIGHDL
jgi:hypothetical protein